MKSFEIGLRDDILATNLRPTLRSDTLCDEELMKQVNKLASNQMERQAKLAAEKKTAKVNACGSADSQKAHECKKPPISENQQVLAALKEMKAELTNLKQKVDDKEKQQLSARIDQLLTPTPRA